MVGNEIKSQEAELLKRIQLLEDKEEILSVISRYSLCVDHLRIDNLLKLFTDDCAFIMYDRSGNKIVRRGRAELREQFPSPPPEGKAQSQHCQLNYVVNVNGDEAVAYGYQLLANPQPQNVSFARSSLRSLKFQRVNGAWYIKEANTMNITNEAECQKMLPQDF